MTNTKPDDVQAEAPDLYVGLPAGTTTWTESMIRTTYPSGQIVDSHITRSPDPVGRGNPFEGKDDAPPEDAVRYCPDCDCEDEAPRDPDDPGAYPGPDPDCDCGCHY